jgi:hypothetical protein
MGKRWICDRDAGDFVCGVEVVAGASVAILLVAGCGARVRGRLRGGPSSLSEGGLTDLGDMLECSGGDVCSAMVAGATCARSGKLPSDAIACD